MKKKLIIIDAFGFFFRSYYALPPLRSKDGFPTGLLTGFINFVNRFNSTLDANYVVFCVDSSGKSFRNDIYNEYKANRKPAPDDLKVQIPIAIEWIKKMGFALLEKSGFEADDLIATVATYAKKCDIYTQIISHDKDMYQLIEDGKISIFDPSKNLIIDRASCCEKFDVHPEDFINFQSILGDSSDNIPGVKGIGQKGASKLIADFKTLEKIYENIDAITPVRTKNLLIQSKESVFLSRELVSLRVDILDNIDFEEFVTPQEPILQIEDELKKYSIKAVLNRAKAETTLLEKTDKPIEAQNEKSVQYITLNNKLDLLNIVNKIPKDLKVAFDTETNSIDVNKAKIVGFSFAFDEKIAYYVPINHNYLGVGEQVSKDEALIAIKEIFKRDVIGQNIKYDLAILKNNFDFFPRFFADTMIMAWILDPSSLVGLDSLAKRFFNHEMIKYSQTVVKGENFSTVAIEEATNYAAEDALFTLKIYNKLDQVLDPVLKKILFDVEFPFIETLIKMESNGIKIDCDFLSGVGVEIDKDLNLLQKDIYELCQEEFNINSPKQLGYILFEKLKLQTQKKTKTGYSTDEKVLNALKKDHLVIEKLLSYREAFKLKSTYIEPLLKMAQTNNENKIFTSFLHTGTSTGRLASKNPNLQNIPVKTKMGRQIREAFVPRDGYLFLSLDYSQIELRLLAHYSKDEVLIDSFLNDRDIHLETSKKIFGDEKAQEMRSLAKSINFGLLYGMGSKKLSETVDISTKDAKIYIDSYFASFPKIRSFIQEQKELVKQKGFVETILGRRRYFDFENAGARFIAMFEREAVNTIFQGSAADLIKLSMLKIFPKIKNRDDVKMLLQIHDELLFEVKIDLIDDVAKEFKEIMQNIYKLEVPLKTSLSIGKNWGELK